MTANPAFEAYYKSLYGERWERLRQSLLEAVPSVPYNGEALAAPYFMDDASILAARSLRLPESGTVLDACAAPGGKSLVIASLLPPGVRLLSNELSSERRRRLVKVLDEHLNKARREQVTVSGFDAARAGSRNWERDRFAGILLDVPCSSERHVMANEKALAKWTAARPRFLAHRQWALLSSAFLMLRPGTPLVYVTCALSAEENDAVAERLIAKYGTQLTTDPPDFREGEKTKYGRIILPDTSGGSGPLYVARFVKNA
jgi:16S rRNA (cytosine1407-C5)-methyltransferase